MPKLVIGVAALGWVAAIVWGGSALLRYSGTGGTTLAAPQTWPEGASLRRGTGDTVVMFAHPFCACTNASVAELDRLLTASQKTATVLFLDPQTSDESWRHSRLVERARAIHGVSVAFDEGGKEAERFGASTSGHVVVYDQSGALRYAGGITQARGHEGWAAGQRALSAIFAGTAPGDAVAPTYGCALSGPQAAEFAEQGKQ